MNYFQNPALRSLIKIMLDDAVADAKAVGLTPQELVVKRLDRLVYDVSGVQKFKRKGKNESKRPYREIEKT